MIRYILSNTRPKIPTKAGYGFAYFRMCAIHRSQQLALLTAKYGDVAAHWLVLGGAP